MASTITFRPTEEQGGFIDGMIESGDFAIPFGLGIGKVMKAGNVVYNMFLEPQFTFLHNGTGQPKVQLFAGLHLQFPK